MCFLLISEFELLEWYSNLRWKVCFLWRETVVHLEKTLAWLLHVRKAPLYFVEMSDLVDE